MKSKLIPKLFLRRAGLVVTLGISGAVVAQTLPKEGNYDFSSCWSGVANIVAFDKTHTAFSYEMTGTTQSSPAGTIFDKSTFRCVGMNYVFPGKPMTGTLVCEGIDAQGDKSLSHYVFDGPNTVRTEIAGTGKYEGMVATGTAVSTGPFPVIKPGTFQSCNRQTGTYKLKSPA
jgi:hypothetical protein